MIKNFKLQNFTLIFLTLFSSLMFLLPENAFAFPIYAQQAYENPREANGRIVCANCHLAQKPTEFESPTSVLPDSVFETVVKIPYDKTKKQILGNGEKGGLNVGAVVVMPDGFKLAPKSRLDTDLKAKTKGVYITPYSPTKENILVVGPISGDKYEEITFPMLSPDPKTNKNVFLLNIQCMLVQTVDVAKFILREKKLITIYLLLLQLVKFKKLNQDKKKWKLLLQQPMVQQNLKWFQMD